MDRGAKLQKLEAFKRKLPPMSAAAMSALLDTVESSGMPEMHGRKHVREATQNALEQHSAYGPLLQSMAVQDKDGVEQTLTFVNIFSLLQALWLASADWRRLLHGTSTRAPGKLIFYSDEINCGNPLAAEATRKVWAIYVSFFELGPINLSKEASWLPLCVVRTSVVSNLPGGMSQVAAVLLKSIFVSGNASPEAGVLLKRPDGRAERLFFRLAAFLQDGAAHKLLFSIKGDAGTRCCLLCRNILASNSIELPEARLLNQCFREAHLQLSSDEDFSRSIVKLLEKHEELTKSDFALWQQAVGIVYQPEGLIFDPELCTVAKPVSQWLHDWMHAFFVRGIWMLAFVKQYIRSIFSFSFPALHLLA